MKITKDMETRCVPPSKITSVFGRKYLRNNRTSGQKSLRYGLVLYAVQSCLNQPAIRCFPLCSESGHSDLSFCGQSINCEFNIAIKDLKYLRDPDIFFIGELRTLYASLGMDQQLSSSSSSYLQFLSNFLTMSAEGSRDAGTNKTYEFVFGTPTSVMLKSSDTIRSKTLDLCDLFSERCVEDCGAGFDWASISVEFKPTGHSWDYSWPSSRWQGATTPHVFEALIFVKGSSSGGGGYYQLASATSSTFIIHSKKLSDICKDSNSSTKLRVLQKEAHVEKSSVPKKRSKTHTSLTDEGACCLDEPGPGAASVQMTQDMNAQIWRSDALNDELRNRLRDSIRDEIRDFFRDRHRDNAVHQRQIQSEQPPITEEMVEFIRPFMVGGDANRLRRDFLRDRKRDSDRDSRRDYEMDLIQNMTPSV